MASVQVYVADRVWDGVAAQPIQRGFVSVDAGQIAAVGRAADLAEGTAFEDLGDSTILPGLINAHVHITFCASTTVLDDYLREREDGIGALTKRAEENMRRAVSVGVTTVRDLGTLNEVVFAMRERVRDGDLVGPDIVAAGEGITSHGGHCYFFGIEAEGPDALRAAVRRQHEAGADCIKVFATGGRLTPGTDPFAPQYSLAELQAVADEARSVGLPIAAHAHATEGIRRSIEARVDTIEHCMFETLDGIDFDERAVEKMAEAGIVAVPTFGATLLRYLEDPAALEELPLPGREIVRRILAHIPVVMANFQRMREMGVKIVAGTDAGIPERHFDDSAADISVLANADVGIAMGNRGALVAATSGCAEALDLDDRGVLAAGKRADVLAVDGNPLVDIADLQRTRLVLTAGRVAHRG